MTVTIDIHTPDDGTITAIEATTQWPPITVGQTAQFEFRLTESDWVTLRSYGDYAGAFDKGFDVDNLPWVGEQLPSDWNHTSLIVGIEPSAELQTHLIDGVWGVLTDMSDERNNTLTDWRLSLSVWVFGRFGRYNSVTDAQNKVLE